MLPYIKALATNIGNLQKSKTDVILNMATYQADVEAFQSIKMDVLLRNPKVKVDFSNWSDDNQIDIFNTLEEFVFFVLH